MTTPSPVEPNKITAVLRPPYISGMTEMKDQPPYDGGIPLRALEGDLQVIINAWETMNIGDRVEMFWGNSSAPVWSKTIELASELNKDVVFRIPEGFILDGEARSVFYRITRPTQGPQDSTPILTLLVKRTRPGGLDDSPEPGHDGLKYTLTPDISNGVDPGMAEQGVQMRIEPYENITVYDRIIARWGSQEVVHYPVTPQQVENSGLIVITFTKAVIEAAGDGPRVAVTYQVIDRCNNYPDERAPWAASTHVLVDLGGNRLNAPLVLVEGRPTNTIDLEQLGEADVVVRVYTPEADFAIDDKIVMTWSGTPAEGGPIVVGPLEQTVEFVPFQCDFIIPNASVKAIAKGWATVSYLRVRDGVANRPSKNASVDVVGEISHLLAPSVKEAPGGALPTETLWATVNIPWYPGRQSSDQVTLIWEAKRADSTVYYGDPRPVGNIADHEPILRSVSNAEIRRFDGLKVKVYYRVANDDALVRSVRESQAFWMQVGEVLPQFVRPEVDEVEPGSDVLDPDNVPPTGATLKVPFLGTQAGDRVSYSWCGSASGGSTSDFVDLTSQTAGKVVKFTVAKSFVIANLNGTVVVDYRIERNGVMLGQSFELRLRVGSAVVELDAPTLVSSATNPIDALHYPNGVDVRVDFTAALAGDQAQLILLNPLPGSPEFAVLLLEQKFAIFKLDAAFLGRWHGKGPQLAWKLIRGGQEIAESLSLVVTVNRIANEDSRLPRLMIDGATADGILDVTEMQDTAQLRVAAWLLQVSGHCVWLRYDGTLENGQQTEKVIWQGAAHASTDGLVTLAAIEWLKTLKGGSDVTITFKVNFDKVANEPTAVAFPLCIYRVRTLPAFELDQTPMILKGINVFIAGTGLNWQPTDHEPAGTAMTRTPTSGTSPFTYLSTYPNIATVDSNGRVRSVGNGSATIKVSNHEGTKSYQVTVSEVYRCLYTPIPQDYESYARWVTDVQGDIPTYLSPHILNVLIAKYTPPPEGFPVTRFGPKFSPSGGWVSATFNATATTGWQRKSLKLHVMAGGMCVTFRP
ncbi:Ig-like domain-containing protein [Pseudomonas sp. RT6P73]